MKTTISIFVTAIFLFANAPKAQAGGEGWAAFGGFLGGVIASGISRDIRNRHHETVVYYEPGHNSYGHYEYRTFKRWVPGCWTYQEDHHGTPVKVWVEGYFTYEKERVWVRNYYRSSYGHSNYGHYSSYYSHGYYSPHHRSRHH